MLGQHNASEEDKPCRTAAEIAAKAPRKTATGPLRLAAAITVGVASLARLQLTTRPRLSVLLPVTSELETHATHVVPLHLSIPKLGICVTTLGPLRPTVISQFHDAEEDHQVSGNLCLCSHQ